MKIGKREVREDIVHSKTLCDICKEPIKHYDYTKGCDIGEILVRGKEIKDNPDWYEVEPDMRTTNELYKAYYHSIDICNNCFFTKIKPYIELIGGKFKMYSIDEYDEFDVIEEENKE